MKILEYSHAWHQMETSFNSFKMLKLLYLVILFYLFFFLSGLLCAYFSDCDISLLRKEILLFIVTLYSNIKE